MPVAQSYQRFGSRAILAQGCHLVSSALLLAQAGSGPVVGAVPLVSGIPTLRLEPRPFGGADLPNCILLCVFFLDFFPGVFWDGD